MPACGTVVQAIGMYLIANAIIPVVPRSYRKLASDLRRQSCSGNRECTRWYVERLSQYRRNTDHDNVPIHHFLVSVFVSDDHVRTRLPIWHLAADTSQ
jgi:hypothetical protein